MDRANLQREPSTTAVAAAFLAVYVVWGSTYLAIRFAIETLPPFSMAGVRFLVAGAFLYGWMRMRGAQRPKALHWRGAFIVGGLLLLGGNGAVVWAEQRVPSGLTALLVATVPLWMMLIDWLRRDGARPKLRVVIGLLLGFAGIGILIGPGEIMGGDRVDPLGAAALIFASLSWATGSIYSRHATLPSSALLATAMQMLAGGTLLAAAGLVTGEWLAFEPAAVTWRSILALLYLIVFGALVGFTCYTWILRVSTPAKVSTYAYVNPVIAVILGWTLADEALSMRTVVATAVIVAAVAFITTARAQERRGLRAPATECDEARPTEPARLKDELSEADGDCPALMERT